MSPSAAALLGFAAGVLAVALWRALEHTRLAQVLARTNHRGLSVDLTLGLALGIGSLAGAGVVVARVAFSSGWARSQGPELIGMAVVFLAGLVDDVVPQTARGLRGHARELVRGRVTTGLLKLVAALLAGVLVVADASQAGDPAWQRIAGVVLIAGAANLWNLLDVAPGRAAKAYLVTAGVLVVVDPGAFLLAASGPVVLLGWFDLRERGMLGDAGANLLGFVIGAEAYLRLPDAGVGVAALGIVALTVLAETVSLSRAIDAVPPLRWFDRLGRRRATTS